MWQTFSSLTRVFIQEGGWVYYTQNFTCNICVTLTKIQKLKERGMSLPSYVVLLFHVHHPYPWQYPALMSQYLIEFDNTIQAWLNAVPPCVYFIVTTDLLFAGADRGSWTASRSMARQVPISQNYDIPRTSKSTLNQQSAYIRNPLKDQIKTKTSYPGNRNDTLYHYLICIEKPCNLAYYNSEYVIPNLSISNKGLATVIGVVGSVLT